MKTIHVPTATFVLLCTVNLAWSQDNAEEAFNNQHGQLNAATNTLQQDVGGSNRASDRFDRTPLDHASGQLRNVIGGSERSHEAAPSSNQSEDLSGSGSGGQSDEGGLLGGGMSGGGSGGGGGGGGMSSYSAASMLHSGADTIRSIGEANQSSAMANVLQQKARKQAIENRYGSVVKYFKVRDANRQLRQSEQPPISTQEDRIRYSRTRLPRQLSDAELNRKVGDIRWPAVLLAPEFDENRQHLEGLFHNRTYYNSGVASANYLEVKAETDRMLATLQDLVDVTEPQPYLQARKFIEGLSSEARSVAGNNRARTSLGR